jgi:hypothetical protein
MVNYVWDFQLYSKKNNKGVNGVQIIDATGIGNKYVY